ncbi:MAG: transposase [Blastocatellia bacterium]|nr:transposase [Blastocatellia bacterium]
MCYTVAAKIRSDAKHINFASGCSEPSPESIVTILQPDASGFPTDEPQALAQYRRRWRIETLFRALKTRGLDLEDPQVRHQDRLQKLVALLALTFCWCHRVNFWLHQQKARKKKKHGRWPQSLFRRGLDCLRRLLVLGTNRNPLLRQQVFHLSSGYEHAITFQ